MKIKIMHVAQAAGGVDRYLQCLIKYLDHDKFENILVCSQDYKEENYSDIVDAFDCIDMQREIGLNDFKAVLVIRRLIKKYHPDIVYAHSSKAGAIVRMADIGIKNSCIYNPHGWAFNMKSSYKKQMIYRIMEKIMVPFCDRIICISDAEKRSALNKKICSDNKLTVIYNGIDIEQYDASERKIVTREELGIPQDAFVVGSVGRLAKQKAPDNFIKMAELVKSQIPNAYFLMVGDGEQREEIELYANQHGLEEVLHITGWVENPMSYIELFDVAMLLSRWEGFGLVIPEYMLCKKPVIATRVDAIPDIIDDGCNGLLVSVDNSADAYRAAVKLYKEIDLRNKLIVQGEKDVREKYDARRVSKEHEVLFEKLVED